MKRNDLVEIKKSDIKTLNERANKERSEITKLMLDKNMGKLTNLREIKNKRHSLAQILTVVRQKMLLQKLEEEHGKA